MKKIKVLCLFGGCSSEYEVSLVSATSVLQNINPDRYDILMVGITRKGDFYLYEGEVEKIEKDEWFSTACSPTFLSCNRSDHGIYVIKDGIYQLIPVDIVLPILHGRNGEDGRLQGMLELAGIPYVGCDMASSLLAMDKYLSHTLVEHYGILVPKSYLFHQSDDKKEIISKISELSYPIFVKPLRAGSSFGITKVLQKKDLIHAIDLAFSYDKKIIIEEAIDGFEVGCAILGNSELVIGEVDEIELQDGFFDYEEKYTLKTSKIHLPARISKEERKKIQDTALQIYRILSCAGFARVDMFYTKDQKIVFNEVNTIPGCTAHSRYPSMLQKVGYSFSEVIDEWIRLGLER